MNDADFPPLKLGILSTANIARHFTNACRGSAKIEVAAVASRDPATAAAFAEKNSVPRTLDSYDALLADPAIEAVYNPLPNSLHAEWTIRALEAGKHVLCEKPLALTADEGRAMFAAARRTGLHLVEAFPYRAQPQTHALAQAVRGGAIGRPRVIQASFGFPAAAATNIRMRPEVGGGALLDAGSYPVSLIRLLAGGKPTRVTAAATWTETGVDGTLIANLEFADGLLAQAACAFGTGIHRRVIVACENGMVASDYQNHLTEGDPGMLEIRRGGWEQTREDPTFPPLSGFLAEAEEFAGLVRGRTDAWTGMTEAESIDVMEMLDAIIAAARSGAAVTL